MVGFARTGIGVLTSSHLGFSLATGQQQDRATQNGDNSS